MNANHVPLSKVWRNTPFKNHTGLGNSFRENFLKSVDIDIDFAEYVFFLIIKQCDDSMINYIQNAFQCEMFDYNERVASILTQLFKCLCCEVQLCIQRHNVDYDPRFSCSKCKTRMLLFTNCILNLFRQESNASKDFDFIVLFYSRYVLLKKECI